MLATIGGAGSAGAETMRYTYDALGRLATVRQEGGSAAGRATSLCYDPAGNRALYNSSAAGAGVTCTLPPPPPAAPPSSANQPPIAVADALTAPRCVVRMVDVIANDTDPDGNVPLTLTSVSGDGAAVASATVISLTTPDAYGSYAIYYTVADTLGATSTGTLNVTVSGSQQCA